jgi:predicted hydrocarbon binding protein
MRAGVLQVHFTRTWVRILACLTQAFRLLPPHTKILEGLTILANAFNQYSDQSVRVEETEADYLWHIERCPICWERHSITPVCHAEVGMLQEALLLGEWRKILLRRRNPVYRPG